MRLSFYALLSLTLLLLCSPAVVFSQQRWERTYGGEGSEYGESVQQTSGGGYIIAGSTGSFGAGNDDVYLIKTNSNGDIIWTRTYGGVYWDYGYSVQQTSDGGYIIAGWTDSFGAGSYDVYLIKTNASGYTLWTRAYGGAIGDFGQSAQQTADGGYIIVGSTNSYGSGYDDVYLIKTNPSGDTLWTRTYGGTSNDEGYSVQQTSDGGYIIAGWTASFGDTRGDVYFLKTNALGDTLWTKTYGGVGNDYGFSVQHTSDGGYIIAGVTNSFGAGYWDVYLIKTNASGNILWTRTYGGTGEDWGSSVHQTSDGGYIIAGCTWSFGAGGDDVYLVKTNATGDTLWTRTYGGTEVDFGFSVSQTSDGGYIITGGTWSFDAGGPDVYIIKTDPDGNVGEENKSFPSPFFVCPNPFISIATVLGHEFESFVIYDISGRKVGVYMGDRIGAGLSAGVYFLKPEGKETKPLRIVKLR